MKKKADEVIWGAYGAIFCALVAALITYTGDMIEGSSPTMLVAGGYFWGVICAAAYNWAGRKK